MKHKDQNVTSLSDSELDDYIVYGVEQQHLVEPHSDDYQHWLNVVAAAKEEKSRRTQDGASAQSAKFADMADKTTDTYTEDRNAPTQLHTAERGEPGVAVGSAPSHGGVGEPLPGVEPDMAGTTPENATSGDETGGRGKKGQLAAPAGKSGTGSAKK